MALDLAALCGAVVFALAWSACAVMMLFPQSSYVGEESEGGQARQSGKDAKSKRLLPIETGTSCQDINN